MTKETNRTRRRRFVSFASWWIWGQPLSAAWVAAVAGDLDDVLIGGVAAVVAAVFVITCGGATATLVRALSLLSHNYLRF